MEERLKHFLGITAEKFSLRKLNIGVCSVFLGLAFVGITTQKVYADTGIGVSAFEQSKSTEKRELTQTGSLENEQLKSNQKGSDVTNKSIILNEQDKGNDENNSDQDPKNCTSESSSIRDNEMQSVNNNSVNAKINDESEATFNLQTKNINTNKEKANINLYKTALYGAPRTKGWHNDGDNWTYSKTDGKQANEEWVLAPDHKWYYFDDNGNMAHDGWVDTNTKDGWFDYYFDHNGHYAVNAWHNDGDNWTYSKTDGKQANEEWVLAPDNKWYYFDDNGNMAHDGWVDTYYNGTWTEYYFDRNGHYSI